MLNNRSKVSIQCSSALMLSLICSVTSAQATSSAPSCTGNLLTDAVAWKQTAAEYQALYYQGYNIARTRLDVALLQHRDTDKPLAIITDVDDTVLNAAPYWGYMISQCKDFFDDALWDKWVPDNQFQAMPGALDFFKYTQSKGVEVFYVSSRDQGDKTLDYMIGNLQALGFPYADAEHVTALRESSNKEPRQKEISQKYNVVVYLGDNLNDFSRAFYVKDVDQRRALMEAQKNEFGKKFILMPNPTDGHWVRAIFGDSEPPATDANRDKFKQAAEKTVWQPKP